MWKWTIRFGVAGLAGSFIIDSRQNPTNALWTHLGMPLMQSMDPESACVFHQSPTHSFPKPNTQIREKKIGLPTKAEIALFFRTTIDRVQYLTHGCHFLLFSHRKFIEAAKYNLLPYLSTLKEAECKRTQALKVRLWGMEFQNPVGVAAGLDKHAEAMDPLLNLGPFLF